MPQSTEEQNQQATPKGTIQEQLAAAQQMQKDGNSPFVDSQSTEIFTPPAPAAEQNNSQQQTEQAQTQTQTEQAQAPVYSGIGGEFKTQEELVAYTKRLEEKAVQDQIKLNAQLPPQTQNQTTVETLSTENKTQEQITEEQASQVFENPQKFAQDLKTDILNSLDARDVKKQQTTDFWNDFYKKHPDLQNQQYLVDSVMKSDFEQIKLLPLDQAKEAIANKTKNIINTIRQNEGLETETMQNTNTTTLETSNVPSNPKDGSTPKKSLNFVEQFKSFQNKRKAN